MPQAWTKWWYKTNEKMIVDYWLNSIGNFAAIPFEVNRAKNKYHDYTYYKQQKNKLFFDIRFEQLNEYITKDQEQTKTFEDIAFSRLVNIYEECFKAFFSYLEHGYFKIRDEVLAEKREKNNSPN